MNGHKRDGKRRTPSEIKISKLKFPKNFAEILQRGDYPLTSVYRGILWEPETPQSILPSFIAVKRIIRSDRKERVKLNI